MAVRRSGPDFKKVTIALQAIEHKLSSGGVLRVGFLEGAKYPETTNARFLKHVGSNAKPTVTPALNIAQAAFWNEFGTKRAPPRPFFRTTIAAESKAWGAALGPSLKHYNFNGEMALRALGQQMRDDLEAAIQRWPADNAPFTVAIKGFNKGLTDSGKMARAPDFELSK